MDIRALFIGLTTVFAWTPATILVILAIFSLASVIFNVAEVPAYLTVALMFVGLGGIAGYIGLSAVCWGLKLKADLILLCLILGVMSLIFTLVMGATSQHELLHIGLNWMDIYLFVSPLIFAFIHIALLEKKRRNNR
jgi:hypothetical protein